LCIGRDVTHQLNQARISDEVPAELFKAGRETVLDRMHRMYVAIWETGEWPEEWTFSAFIGESTSMMWPTFRSRTAKEQLVS